MSITALVVLFVYGAGLLIGVLVQPVFALFSYLWIFYNDPTTRWWGTEVPEWRYSLFAAAVALIATLRLKDRPTTPWISHGGIKLLIGYAVWTWIQTFWAIETEVHLEGAILFTKYVALSYIIYQATATEKNLELFLWAHIAGCFLFGWEAYTTEVSGRLETIGGPGVDDSNLLAAHVLTGLVVAGFLFIGVKGKRRWVAFVILPFIMNTIVLTQSRGAFIALIGAGAAAWFFSPAAYRKIVGLAGVLGILLLFMLSNDSFWERISTAFESEEAATQETRVQLIGPQIEMFKDHPLGAGHRGNEFLSPQYMPPELLTSIGRRSAHNTFLASLVDQGFPGAVLLLGLYAWAFLSLCRLKRFDRWGLTPSLGMLRAGIGSGLASLFVSGLFLNLLKTEVQVWLLAALASLIVLCERAVQQEQVRAAQAHEGTAEVAVSNV